MSVGQNGQVDRNTLCHPKQEALSGGLGFTIGDHEELLRGTFPALRQPI